MSDSRAAAAIDRLPWLEDEPHRTPNIAWSGLWRWAVPALLLVAGISFWLGTRTAPGNEFDAPVARTPAGPRPATTVALPEAEPAIAEQQAPITPEARDIAEPQPPRAAARPVVRNGRAVTRRQGVPRRRVTAAARPEPVPHSPQLQYWPALTSAGASGRMVRIGTFASSSQAKRGWRAVVRVYPGMKRIPTVVVPLASLRDGRTYFRLQMGTTSQAHSEVLCQRMRVIGQSCVVVGLAKAAT